MTRISVIMALCLFAMPGFGQTADLASLLSGGDRPRTMTLKQFDSAWMRVLIEPMDTGGSGSMMEQLAQIGMLSDDSSPDKSLGLALLSSMSGRGKNTVLFTKGATLTIGSETFLIGYRPVKNAPNLLQAALESEKAGKDLDPSTLFGSARWNEDTVTELSLINTRAIGAISSVRQFELAREIDEGAPGSMSMLETLMLLGQSTSHQHSAPKEAKVGQAKPPAPQTKPSSTTKPRKK